MLLLRDLRVKASPYLSARERVFTRHRSPLLASFNEAD
jgi:hypothetical protein